jgi:hypothetical protein
MSATPDVDVFVSYNTAMRMETYGLPGRITSPLRPARYWAMRSALSREDPLDVKVRGADGDLFPLPA